MQYNHNYIYLENLLLIVYNWFCNCRNRKHIPQNLEYLFLQSVKSKDRDNISYYLSTYENKRNENRYLYDEYVQKRLILYNKWNTTKNNTDLIKLLYFSKLNLEEIPEIYTKKRYKTMLK